jgi:hypothetical protein
MNRSRSSVKPSVTGPIWTVVSLVRERISCTIHSSEYHAYREAVSRFESVELGSTGKDPDLKALLEAANASDDYQRVRKYIEDKACQIRLIQLAEHTMSDLNSRQLSAPRLARSRVRRSATAD